MSEKINVDQAFNPEARQAQSDFDSYLESRPYKDEYGNTRNTEGKVVGSSYFDTQRDQHETDTLPTAYEDMSMPDLARALASAEHQEDKTKAGDIQDTLIEKMAEFTEKNNLDSDAQDNLYNRIMKVKDAESEKLDGGKTQDDINDVVEALDTDSNEVTDDRKTQIIDEIIQIKRGMADRAARGLDNPKYDVDFEDSEDQKVVELLKEAYGTGDENDPRITNAVKELDQFEEVLTDYDDSHDYDDNENHSESSLLDDLSKIPDLEQGGQIDGDLEIATVNSENVPINDEKLTFRQRVVDIARKIDVKARELAGRMGEYFTDTEKGKRRRIVAAGAGILALGATVALAKYGISTGGGASEHKMTAAEKLVRKNPKEFNRMIEWYKAQKKANPGASTEKLANSFTKFLEGVKK